MLFVFCLSLSSLCWEKQNNSQWKYKVTGSKCTQHIWKFIYFFDWGTGEGERKKHLEKSLEMWENFAMLSKHYVSVRTWTRESHWAHKMRNKHFNQIELILKSEHKKNSTFIPNSNWS